MKTFLTFLINILEKIYKGKRLPDNVSICRFLFKDDFRTDGLIKPKAFKPSKKQKKLSAFRIDKIDDSYVDVNLTEIEVWELADKNIGVRNGGVVGRVDFNHKYVRDQEPSLKVVEDIWGPKRHVNILPFPIVKKSMNKEEEDQVDRIRNKLATRLAQNLSLIRRP